MALAVGVLARHGLRLSLVFRLARSGVLEEWPWRVGWPWVAGVSALVLGIGLPWLLAFVRGAAWARREARGLGVAYLLWSFAERLFWVPEAPSTPAALVAAGVTAAKIGFWLALHRLTTQADAPASFAAHRSKEAT